MPSKLSEKYLFAMIKRKNYRVLNGWAYFFGGGCVSEAALCPVSLNKGGYYNMKILR